MIKKAGLLLVLAVVQVALCKAQRLFTGTVEYKIVVTSSLRDTMSVTCQYAPQYLKLTPIGADKSGERNDEEVILDWAANCFYVIKKAEKKILKKSFDQRDTSFRFTGEYKYPDSVVLIDGIKGSLYNRTLADSTSFDTWLADSLAIPVSAALSNHSDFFVFCQKKLMLKMQLKDKSRVLTERGQPMGVVITAENIQQLPQDDVPYKLPAGYQLIEEEEQKRISDSLLRAFKDLDSALSVSNVHFDSTMAAMTASDNALKKMQAILQEQHKSTKKKKTTSNPKKQAARKPAGTSVKH
jgi:hypothetical protein